MYTRYFGLKRAPFSIAPDPSYLYLSPQHEEALAHLLYGIRTEGGFVLLTGEVGSGKTTVCRRFLETLSSDIAVAFILSPTLSVKELLSTVCDEFGIRHPRQVTIKGLVDRIHAYLLELNANRKRAVLIIDEAQDLKREVLEQIRLLTNLETNERKLLQIILIGQPELRTRLAQPDMRQVSQRIVARCHIDALSKPEVERYVTHRLAIARRGREVEAGGAQSLPLFSKDALNSLYASSGGIPRVINLVCDRALLGAYTRQEQIVTRETLLKAAAEVLGRSRVEGGRKWKVALGSAVGLCASFVLLYVCFSAPKMTFAGKTRHIFRADGARAGPPESLLAAFRSLFASHARRRDAAFTEGAVVRPIPRGEPPQPGGGPPQPGCPPASRAGQAEAAPRS